MGNLERLTARLQKRDAALKDRKELLSRIGVRRDDPPKADGAATPPVSPPEAKPPVSPPPKIAAVRMIGDPILNLTVDGNGERLHLTPALRECADLYLKAAQCGTREFVLLWPGTLDCLPLIHGLATLEFWSQGYKLGLRGVLYPATNASFRRLNHVFADREDISVINAEVEGVTDGTRTSAKQSCEAKDLMLWALNSLKDEAKAANLQPCLNELLPHFDLSTGTKAELLGQNYGERYLGHLVRKLSRQGHGDHLRDNVLPKLGDPKTAPDAMFGLSFRMRRSQIEDALRTLKSIGPLHVVLVDATRAAFDRVAAEEKRLDHRVVTLLRIINEVFGDAQPGLLIVTDDPRRMTLLRNAIAREEKVQQVCFKLPETRALRLARSGLGLQRGMEEEVPALGPSSINVEVTDRESARVVNAGYRLAHEHSVPPAVADALSRAARMVQTMGNLPSAPELVYKWLDESMADDAQRRRYDWVAMRNAVVGTRDSVPIDLGRRVNEWLSQAEAVLKAQHDGTPLARALLARVKRCVEASEKVLVVVQTKLYADLAREYLLRDPEGERLVERVHVVPLRMLQERLSSIAPDRLLVCSVSPEFLRWVVTTAELPGPVEFLLTQQTALTTYYALQPVLACKEFGPYLQRVQAIYGPIREAQGTIGAVMPEFDCEAPAITFTTGGGAPAGERGPIDYVEIGLEDGRQILRGRNARVYVYDPSAKESRALGFRPKPAYALVAGDLLFVMSDALREEAEAAFTSAGVVFDEATRYEATLRKYHDAVHERVKERYGHNIAEAARLIREAMALANCTQDTSNVRYWINLRNADSTPFAELMPQAPRHFETFKTFMAVLGFDETMTKVYWEGAVKRVRGTRISDGLNLNDHYDRVLFDPEDAATYDRLTPAVLNAVRSRALDNVYEVTGIAFGTTSPRVLNADPALRS
jgi:hypothetical protein